MNKVLSGAFISTLLFLASITPARAQSSDVCLEEDLAAALSASASADACNLDGAFIGAAGLAEQIILKAQEQKNKPRCIKVLNDGRKAAISTGKFLVTIGSWLPEYLTALVAALKPTTLSAVCADLPSKPGSPDEPKNEKPSPIPTVAPSPSPSPGGDNGSKPPAPQPSPTQQPSPEQGLTSKFSSAVQQNCCVGSARVVEFGGCVAGPKGVVAKFVKDNASDPNINKFKEALSSKLSQFIATYQCRG
jgi:hypothetical protein